MRIGAYDQTPAPFMGPLVPPTAVKQVRSAEAHFKAHGGMVLLGAQETLLDCHPQGHFVSPSIIDNTALSADIRKRLFDHEIFGPLVQLYQCNTLDAAIELANDTQYGLAASVITEEIENFNRCYAALNAGVINWNYPTTHAASELPFGGVGVSGNYRPSGFYAADYCAYPVSSQQYAHTQLPHDFFPSSLTLSLQSSP